MSVSKQISFSAVALLSAFISVAEARADHPHVVGLPIARPTHPVMGMPVHPGHPVMGMPIHPGHPPVMGIVIRPPRPVGLPIGFRPPVVVGMPVRPPVFPPRPIGLPIPQFRSFELECYAKSGNVSGLDRVKLDINQTSANSYNVNGFIRYYDGSEAQVATYALGSIFRGNVNLQLDQVGTVQLNPTRIGFFRQDLEGNVNLYGRLDSFGLSCQLDRE